MHTHEICFTFLMVTLIVRLPMLGGMLFGALLLISLWIIFRGKVWLQRIAQVAYVPLLYFSFKKIVPLLNESKYDILLQKADSLFLSQNLSLQMRSITHPILTEILYICYMLFFAYIILTLWHHRKKESFYVGLFSIYWIGFFCYTLLPALGPYLAVPELALYPLRQGLLCSAPIYDFLLTSNNQADIFPSLHCAISAFCLCYDAMHNRKRFWLYLPLVVAIWFSTIYLGYHYLTDLIAGAFLTFFGLLLVRSRSTMKQNLKFQKL